MEEDFEFGGTRGVNPLVPQLGPGLAALRIGTELLPELDAGRPLSEKAYREGEVASSGLDPVLEANFGLLEPRRGGPDSREK